MHTPNADQPRLRHILTTAWNRDSFSSPGETVDDTHRRILSIAADLLEPQQIEGVRNAMLLNVINPVTEISGDDNSEGSGKGFHGLQIPNLDGLPDDDLEAIAAELRKVQDYIVATLGARAARLTGRVRIAAIFEGQAESIYKTFAPELKW